MLLCGMSLADEALAIVEDEIWEIETTFGFGICLYISYVCVFLSQ